MIFQVTSVTSNDVLAHIFPFKLPCGVSRTHYYNMSHIPSLWCLCVVVHSLANCWSDRWTWMSKVSVLSSALTSAGEANHLMLEHLRGIGERKVAGRADAFLLNYFTEDESPRSFVDTLVDLVCDDRGWVSMFILVFVFPTEWKGHESSRRLWQMPKE